MSLGEIPTPWNPQDPQEFRSWDTLLLSGLTLAFFAPKLRTPLIRGPLKQHPPYAFRSPSPYPRPDILPVGGIVHFSGLFR